MLIPVVLPLVLLLDPPPVPSLPIVAVERSYAVAAAAAGENAFASEASGLLFGQWEREADVQAPVSPASAVPEASAYVLHESDVWNTFVSVHLGVDADAVAAGGAGLGAWSVPASLPDPGPWARSETRLSVRLVVRETFRFEVDTDLTTAGEGTHLELKIVAHTGQRAVHHAASGGETLAAISRGWLPAGTWSIEAYALARAPAVSPRSRQPRSRQPRSSQPRSNQPRSNQTGFLDAFFRVGYAADFEMDADVDRADRDAFRSAWAVGSLQADFDADGDVDAADWEAFRSAWEARALPGPAPARVQVGVRRPGPRRGGWCGRSRWPAGAPG